jgi:hypothetical protein
MIYQLTGFGIVDSLGAIGLIYFSIREGREAFEKAEGLSDICHCDKKEETEACCQQKTRCSDKSRC